MKTFYLKLIISLSLIMVLFTGCQQADFATKNQGKYSNYINASKETRLSELKKSKIDKEDVVFIYNNVIYEKELKKDEMVSIKNDDSIAEYLVCLVDKVNEKNSINFYMCKINKSDFKQIVKAKLTDMKDYNLNDVVGDAVKGAVGTEKNIGGNIGSVAGNFIGDILPIPGVDEVLGAVGGAVGENAYNIINNIVTNNAKLDEYLNEIPEETYNQIYTEWASIFVPKITKVDDSKLVEYFDEKQLKVIEKIKKKYNVGR